MNIYDKIENMFKDELDLSNQEALKMILNELSEIKQILKFSPKQYKNEYKKTLPKEYFEFVRQFRLDMKEDRINGIFPEIEFEGLRLGINDRGFLYNKDTGKILPRYKAFEIYEKLYYQYTIRKKFDSVF